MLHPWLMIRRRRRSRRSCSGWCSKQSAQVWEGECRADPCAVNAAWCPAKSAAQMTTPCQNCPRRSSRNGRSLRIAVLLAPPLPHACNLSSHVLFRFHIYHNQYMSKIGNTHDRAHYCCCCCCCCCRKCATLASWRSLNRRMYWRCAVILACASLSSRCSRMHVRAAP